MTYEQLQSLSLGEATRTDLKKFVKDPSIVAAVAHDGFYILIESDRMVHVKMDEDELRRALNLTGIALEWAKGKDDYEPVDNLDEFFENLPTDWLVDIVIHNFYKTDVRI